MSSEKKIALVLGGTVPHVELIRQLHEREYYVILVDYLENPMAKHAADEHFQVSTLDKEKVYEIAVLTKADIVITTSIDQANITACYVMEKLGKPLPYSYDTALRVTNKGDMKKTMWEHGIPTSKYRYYEKNEFPSIDIGLEYPIVVKPADANSANGVKIADNYNELITYFHDASEISRNGRTIIEEYVEGREASVYCFVSEQKTNILMIAERFSIVDGDENAIKCYASMTGMELTIKAKQSIQRAADGLAKAYGFHNTPLFMQIIVKDDDIAILEFAPRTGGGMCFQTIYRNTGFDYIGAAIDSFLNIPVKVDYSIPKYVYAVSTLYAKDGVYNSMTGYQELMEDVIDGIYEIKPKGTRITTGTASGERIAFLLIKGETRREVKEKALKAITSLDVVDMDGSSILRRDIHL